MDWYKQQENCFNHLLKLDRCIYYDPVVFLVLHPTDTYMLRSEDVQIAHSGYTVETLAEWITNPKAAINVALNI